MEGGAIGGGEAERVLELPPPGDAAGVRAAELLVVVVARGKLEVVVAPRGEDLCEDPLVVASAHRVPGGSGKAILPVVESDGEQMRLADVDVVLQRHFVAPGDELRPEFAVEEAVQLVATPPACNVVRQPSRGEAAKVPA